MGKIKNLILMVSATILLVSCGSNIIGDYNNKEDSTTPIELNGTIWSGPYGNNVIAVNIKNDSELVFDQCFSSNEAIEHVKTEKNGTSFFRIFTYKQEGNKFVITGVKDGKDNEKKLKEFYVENEKLTLKNENGQIVVTVGLVKNNNNEDPDKKYIFDEINKFRQENGKSVIVGSDNPCIKAIAEQRVKEIEKHFAHERPDGRPLDTIINEVEVCKLARPWGQGEIIGEYSSAYAVMEEWKSSSGHASTMLNNFNQAVVAKNGRFWVVFFGKYPNF